MSEKPSAVIFDVGNVLYGWDPESFLVTQVAEDRERLKFIEDVGLWEWHDTLDGGLGNDVYVVDGGDTDDAGGERARMRRSAMTTAAVLLLVAGCGGGEPADPAPAGSVRLDPPTSAGAGADPDWPTWDRFCQRS